MKGKLQNTDLEMEMELIFYRNCVIKFQSPDNQEYATILNKNLTFIFWKLSTTMNHEKLSEHVFPEL